MKPVILFLVLIISLSATVLLTYDPIKPMPVYIIAPTRPPLYFGIIPYLTPGQVKQEVDPVLQYLELKLGRPVALAISADYRNLGRLLELGKIHVAWFSHASLEQLRGDHKWDIICRPAHHGSVMYSGEIITREESAIQTINDLKGKTFAYVDRFSGSGYYFPNLYFRDHGIKPLEFFGNIVFTRSHNSSIDGVLAGTYDGAAVFSAKSIAREPERAERIRFLATTGPIPNDPLVVRRNMQPELKARLKSLLLQMHEDPMGKPFMEKLRQYRGTSRFVSEEEVQTLVKIQSENPPNPQPSELPAASQSIPGPDRQGGRFPNGP